MFLLSLMSHFSSKLPKTISMSIMTTKQVDFADLRKGAGRSIIGRQIFVYSCSAQLISFEIDWFYSLRRRVYEYLPPPPP